MLIDPSETIVDFYDASAHAGGWHNVRAPGGYEWWYFDAEDPTTDTQVVAIFMEGFIFHPGYLRAYAKYRRRPTKVVPPTAGDFPCVYLCVYRGGEVWRQFFTQYPRAAFSAARDRCEVTIGPNTLRVDESGAYQLTLSGSPWKLTARGPVTRRDVKLSARLTFEPTARVAPIERTFLSRAMTGAHHAWAIVAPRCNVRGTIDCDDAIAFGGVGYHDHNFGTAPIGDGLARWTWGRAMFDDGKTLTFHHAEPTDTRRTPETHLIEAGEETREHAVEKVRLGEILRCRPAMMLGYRSSLDFGPALRLTNPRIIDPSPFYLRLQYAAESFGRRATAFCEIAYPHRLHWPLLGRLIEMSFDRAS